MGADMTRRLAAILFLAGCASGTQTPGPDPECTGDGKCDSSGATNDPYKEVGDIETRDFEYIVVGSGAGGGPLAANLARQGHTVLLLEAGKEAGGKLEYQIPAIHPRATETKDLAWAYYVDHYADPARAAQDTKHTGEGILYPRGGTLGGSTAVNAMITIAPSNGDWDHIADVTGDTTWRHEQMNPYFDRVQAWLGVESPDIPIDALFDSHLMSILTAAFKEAAIAGLGGPDVDETNPLANIHVFLQFLTRDVNAEIQGGAAEGVFQIPLATRDHKRNGTREYLIKTVNDARRFPLRIKTQALVTKVDFDDEPGADGQLHATGVDFLDGANLYAADLGSASAAAEPRLVHAHATREVILAAGAFNTPQLLMLSGIGASDELAAQGIETRVDLPGVGKNLQDRYEVGVVSQVSKDFAAEKRCTFKTDRNDPCFQDWRDGEGAYTSNGGVISLLAKSKPTLAEPDLHIFGLPGVFKGYYPGYSADTNKDKHHFTWVILKAHTQNKAGTVSLRSADPRERPQIDFHYFDDGDVDAGQDQNDLTAVVDGIGLVRKIEARSDKDDLSASQTEVWPGPSVSSRAALGDWVKKEAWGHHASCSAHIGAADDPEAVLDSRFHVRGVSNLRVVDASVFPSIPGTFIVVPVYMVSEKATDVILEDLGEVRNESNFLH